MAKAQITMPDELLAKLDDYADRNYTTRSGAITMMVNNYLVSRELTVQMQQVTDALCKMAAGGQLSEAEQQQLLAFEQVAKMLPER